MGKAALGFKPRTGRAVLVVLLEWTGSWKLVEGARANGIEPATLPDKAAFDAAAKTLGIKRAKLDAELAAIGKAAGPPWAQYQREAAAAALVALRAR